MSEGDWLLYRRRRVLSEYSKDSSTTAGVNPAGVAPAAARPAGGLAGLLSAWRERLAILGGVDLRSLAVLRVGLAVLLGVDLASRAGDLSAHYSDAGVLPRSALFESEGLRAYLSLHSLSGSVWWQAALFLLAGYFALMLLLGVRTRLATFASWVLLLSLHHRNPVVLQAGDALLRLLLFWGMLLPLGARWSVDSAAGPMTLYRRKDNRLVSVAGVAIMLQVCLVYWFTATFKDHPMWWHQNAAYVALNIDQLVTPFGMWIRQIDWLLPILTWTAFGMAIAAPLLVFSPVWTGTARMLVIFAMIATHLALAMSLKLGLLPYVAAVSWLVFIPGKWWDWLRARFRQQAGLRARPSRPFWLLALLRRLPMIVSGSRRGTGDVLIDIPTDRQQRIKARGWEQVVASLALIYAVAWNIQWLDSRSDNPIIPVRVTAVGDVLRMEQGWNMISTEALTLDGWFVMPAVLVDGTRIDVLTGGPVNWSNPTAIAGNNPGTRWRKYLRNLAKPRYRYNLHPFANYLARTFDAEHSPDKKLESFDIIFIKETTLPDGKVELTRQKLLEYHLGP
jgi:hypothetical protein